MELTRVESAAAFRERALSFLLSREAEHNLLLSALGKLAAADAPAAPEAYFAVVDEESRVVAAAVMAPSANLFVSVVEDDRALALLAADLRDAERPVPGVVAPSAVARGFVDRFAALTGRPASRYMALRLFRLEQVSPPTAVPGTMRRMAEEDRAVVRRWMVEFIRDANLRDAVPDEAEQDRIVDGRLALPPDQAPGLYVWEAAGQVVSMANVVDRTPSGKHVNGVFTPAAQRRRGYASALVAEVSRRVLDGGHAFVTLFTDLTNPTSNRIYQAVGFRPVCDVDDYRFEVTAAAPTAAVPG